MTYKKLKPFVKPRAFTETDSAVMKNVSGLQKSVQPFPHAMRYTKGKLTKLITYLTRLCQEKALHQFKKACKAKLTALRVQLTPRSSF